MYSHGTVLRDKGVNNFQNISWDFDWLRGDVLE